MTFGDAVITTPPAELEGEFLEDEYPLAVDVTITNHGDQVQTGLWFRLMFAGGSDPRGGSLPDGWAFDRLYNPAVQSSIPPGETVQWPLLFGAPKAHEVRRVEAVSKDGPIVAARDL